MSVDQLINVLAAVTLIGMMITIGLGVTLPDVLKAGKNWELAARAVIANYFLVPGAAVGLLFLFHANPMVAAGFLVVAACPGAPFGPPFTAIAKGNTTLAVGLMVILAASSAVLAPLLLGFLLPVIGGRAAPKLNVTRLVETLFGAQLLPLCVGLWLRKQHPRFADRLIKPARIASLLLNLLTFTAIIAAQFSMLKQIRVRGCVGMLCLVAAGLGAGRLMAGTVAVIAKSLTITTAVRNAGVALVIATGSFPGTAAITSATAFAIFQTISIALIALAWGRFTPGIQIVEQKAI